MLYLTKTKVPKSIALVGYDFLVFVLTIVFVVSSQGVCTNFHGDYTGVASLKQCDYSGW